MATHDLHFHSLVGPGVTPVEKSYVEVKSANDYFIDGTAVVWSVPRSYEFVNGEVTVPGMSDTDAAGDDVAWAVKHVFTDGRGHVSGPSPTTTFKFKPGAGSTVEWTDDAAIEEVDPVEPVEWGPTYLAQTKELRDETAEFRDAVAESVASISKGTANGVAGLDGGARVPQVQLPEHLTPTALSNTIVTEAKPVADESSLAWASMDAWVNFATQPNGAPAATLDTGQPVDYTLGLVSNRAPVISSGKLKHGPSVGTGTYANYYQAQLDGNCRLFGCRYVVDSSTGTTAGIMCLAAWADVFEAGGNIPPRTPGHITINTLTNTWEWWVSDGDGPAATHLRSIKQGTFTAPAKDGVAVWETAAYIDAPNGIGYLLLPGADTTTGKRIVTLTNAEIAEFLTAVSLPVSTLAQLQAGADVLMIEHYAVTNANTAIFPEFITAYGEVERSARDVGRTLRTAATSSPQPTYLRLNPTTMVTDDAGTSSASVANSAFTATYGPTGKILFEVVAWYEFTRGADTIFMRMVVGSGNTTLEAATIGVSGEKKTVTKRMEASGGTPGASVTCTLQHSSVNANADLMIGGSGGSMRPGLYITATPI